MKKVLFILAILCSVITEAQNVKITEMPTFIGDPSGGWVPVVILGTNRKVDASYFGYKKMDSITVVQGTAYDTLYVYKNGVKAYYKLIRAGSGSSEQAVLTDGGEAFRILAKPDDTTALIKDLDTSRYVKFDSNAVKITPWVDTTNLFTDIRATIPTLSLSAIGSTPNANGASVTGHVFNLQPASASFGGVITTGTQTFAGSKTFNSNITVSDLTVGTGNTSDSTNVAIGLNTLTSSVSGMQNNVAIGNGAMQDYNNSAADLNIAIGNNALNGTSGNAALYNVAIGAGSMQAATAPISNIAIGYFALQLITDGQYNVSIGNTNLSNLSTGDDNIAIGGNALNFLTTGNRNIAIGRDAGYNPDVATSNSIFIGYNAGRNLGDSNQLWIENSSSSSPLIFGNFSADTLRFNAAVSIRDVDSVSSTMNMATIDASGRIKKAAVPTGGGGGSGTVTEVAEGWGISIFGGSITTSGFVNADSGLVTSRNWHQKGMDSLGALISGSNQNISNANLTADGDHTLTLGGYELTMAGTSTQGALIVTNSGGRAINATTSATSNYAIFGTGTGSSTVGVGGTGTSTGVKGTAGGAGSGTGVYGESTSGTGIEGGSTTGYAGAFYQSNTTNNSIENVVNVSRATSGTAANGIGTAIRFATETDNNSTQLSGQLAFKWTDVVNATRTSAFEVYGVNAATLSRKFAIAGDGSITADGYGDGTITGTATYYAAWNADGKLIEVEAPEGGGGGTTETASNGLTKIGNDIQLGGTLTKTDTISTSTYQLKILGASTDPTLFLSSADGTGIGLDVVSTATAIQATSWAAPALTTYSYGDVAAAFNVEVGSTNTDQRIFNISRATSGTPANGISGSFQFAIETSNGTNEASSELRSSWTNVTHSSRTSALEIWGVNNATLARKAAFNGDGSLVLDGYASVVNDGASSKSLNVNSSGKLVTVDAGDEWELLDKEMGANYKSQNFPFFMTPSGVIRSLADGAVNYFAIRIKEPQEIIGLKFMLSTAGDFTEDNTNGVALYKPDGDSIRLVAQSANSSAIFEGAANTVTSAAFTSPYNADKGLYYLAFLQNNSSQVQAPGLAAKTNLPTGSQTFSGKYYGYVKTGQSTFLNAYAFSELTGHASVAWVATY